MVLLVETLADGTELMNRETMADCIHSYVADVVHDVIKDNPDSIVKVDTNDVLTTVGMIMIGALGPETAMEMLFTMLLNTKPEQLCQMYRAIFGRDVTTKDGEFFYISPVEDGV